MEKYLTTKNILIVVGIIIFDFIVYIFLGLMLMNYEDFYDESKGEYWSLQSMDFWQKVNYIGFDVWNLINLIAIGYIIYRIVKEIKKRPTTKAQMPAHLLEWPESGKTLYLKANRNIQPSRHGHPRSQAGHLC